MANSELYITDSSTNNWRRMTELDLQTAHISITGQNEVTIDNFAAGATIKNNVPVTGDLTISSLPSITVASAPSTAVTNTPLTNLDACLNGANQVEVAIGAVATQVPVINDHLTELGAAINTNRVDVNIANGGFDGAVTNAGLTALNTTIDEGSGEINVTIKGCTDLSASPIYVLPAGASFSERTSDGSFKATAGTLYSVQVSTVGVTAGDTLKIRDDATDIITFTATAANETFSFTPSVGVTCSTNINVIESLAVAGAWAATAVYR